MNAAIKSEGQAHWKPHSPLSRVTSVYSLMHNVREADGKCSMTREFYLTAFSKLYVKYVNKWEWRDMWRIEDRGGGNRDWEKIMYEIPPLSFVPRLPWPEDDFLNNHAKSELSFCMRGVTRPRNGALLRQPTRGVREREIVFVKEGDRIKLEMSE